MTELTEEIRVFADKLAVRIEQRDYSGVHAMFAPWLQADTAHSGLQSAVESWLREIGNDFELEELVYPDGHEIGAGLISLNELRHLAQSGMTEAPIPDELTDESFVLWMNIKFLCQDESIEINEWFDLWIAVARIDAGLVVGYYEVAEAD